MQRQRTRVSPNNRWWLPENAFREALYFAYQYKELKDELEVIGTGERAINYDPQPKGTATSKPVEDLAIKRSKIADKIARIESACRLTDAELYPWLILGVTDREIGYDYLSTRLNIPCSRNTYYERRRKFYYILWTEKM